RDIKQTMDRLLLQTGNSSVIDNIPIGPIEHQITHIKSDNTADRKDYYRCEKMNLVSKLADRVQQTYKDDLITDDELFEDFIYEFMVKPRVNFINDIVFFIGYFKGNNAINYESDISSKYVDVLGHSDVNFYAEIVSERIKTYEGRKNLERLFINL